MPKATARGRLTVKKAAAQKPRGRWIIGRLPATYAAPDRPRDCPLRQVLMNDLRSAP